MTRLLRTATIMISIAATATLPCGLLLNNANLSTQRQFSVAAATSSINPELPTTHDWTSWPNDHDWFSEIDHSASSLLEEPPATHTVETGTHDGSTRDSGFEHYVDSSCHCCLSAVHESDTDTKFEDSTVHHEPSAVHDPDSADWPPSPGMEGNGYNYYLCSGTPNRGDLIQEGPVRYNLLMNRGQDYLIDLPVHGVITTYDTPRRRTLYGQASADVLGGEWAGSDILLLGGVSTTPQQGKLLSHLDHEGCGVHTWHTVSVGGAEYIFKKPGRLDLRWKLDPLPEIEGDGVPGQTFDVNFFKYPANDILYKNFIPCQVVRAIDPLGVPPPPPAVRYYNGDYREFGYYLGYGTNGTSKTYLKTFATHHPSFPGKLLALDRAHGTTYEYDPADVIDTGGFSTCHFILKPFSIPINYATLPATNNTINIWVVGAVPGEPPTRSIRLHIHCHAAIPLQLAPAIDFECDLDIVDWEAVDNAYLDQTTVITEIDVTGIHDRFPAHELYTCLTELYRFDPRPGNFGPSQLMGLVQQQFGASKWINWALDW